MNLLRLIIVSFVFVAASQAMATSADLNGNYVGSVDGQECKVKIETKEATDLKKMVLDSYDKSAEARPEVDRDTLVAALGNIVFVDVTPQTDCLSGKDNRVQFFRDVDGYIVGEINGQKVGLSFINGSNGSSKIVLQSESSMFLLTRVAQK